MLIPPGFANIQWRMTNGTGGQHALTAMGVALEDADPETVLNGAAEAWGDNIDAIVDDAWNGDAVVLVIGTADPSAPITIVGPEFSAGTNNGENTGPQVCTLFRKQTLTGGRKGRGRMYIPTPAASGVDDGGRFSPSQHEDNMDRAAAFASDLAAIDGVAGLYVFHNDEDDAPSQLVALLSDPMTATIRHRLRR